MTYPLLQTISSFLPSDWTLSNLISLDHGWQANICDGEYVVIGTGATPEEALADAADKSTNTANFIGRLAHLPRLQEAPTLEATARLVALGLITAKPQETFRRI